MNQDLNEKAIEFLISHGWKVGDDRIHWFHEIFPMGEDLSGNNAFEFVENFYGKAWKTFRDSIVSVEILNGEGGE